MTLFKKAAEDLRKEYQCFLDYVELNEIQLSKRTDRFGKKDCFNLNALFTVVCERYKTCGRTQDYYTVIDFFYFFSISADILQITNKKGKGLTLQKSEKYHLFSQMSVMEQYILMMTIWLGEYQMTLEKSLSMFMGLGLFDQINREEGEYALTSQYGEMVKNAWGICYLPEIRLLALFQLIRIEWLEENEDEKNTFRIKELYKTAEGCYFKKLLVSHNVIFWSGMDIGKVLIIIRNIATEGDSDNSYNIEEKLLNFLENPIEIGVHTIEFKIMVSSCVRNVTMGDHFTLEDLHNLIQKSVDFDSDHLYYFQIGSGAFQKRYFAPECADEKWLANEVSLAELGLREGKQFEYVFDFGDEWHFQITVEHILNEHTQKCEIKRIKGKNPQQYYDCDE
jgi:Plasmid pRiA4b ORF-3-like protein.